MSGVYPAEKPRLATVIPLRRKSGTFEEHSSDWRATRPGRGESWRWESAGGHWISVTMGHDDELGQAIVSASDGRRQRCDSVEEALGVARAWRA
jgi:anti-sigma factor ChrR (cupin superfamily)